MTNTERKKLIDFNEILVNRCLESTDPDEVESLLEQIAMTEAILLEST